MCKGADTVITERLTSESLNSYTFKTTQKYVDGFAEEGLRTLYLAERYINEDEYEAWNKESKQSKLEINNRDEKVAAVDEKIEINLELIGSTAIEDRLQDEVADTIQFMKNTGIKVWVLTGDKIETAMNIGVSAGLLDNTMG
jgi:magnesium-transporting ATPase (P-type)